MTESETKMQSYKQDKIIVIDSPILETRGLTAGYQSKTVLKNISITIKRNAITAFMGPSGCGKSTLLRVFNRMNDYIEGYWFKGEILFKNKNIYDKDVKLSNLRRQISMVFQKPNPFPKSIYENVAIGLRIHGIKDKKVIDETVERCLRMAALWDEVKDDLKKNAYNLSGGQQQRLCIARALAVSPEVILLDEPASALDPISTAKLEEVLLQLKSNVTIILVTHNMQQAARISDYTAFLYMGELIEYNLTREIFTNPAEQITQQYITGRIG